MDINVNDDHTVWCTIARAADAHLFDSDDSSHNDNGSDGSGVDSCYPVGLKPDSGGQGSVLISISYTMILVCMHVPKVILVMRK